ncbi:alpha-1,2-fucosyltransferase [Helicobacter pylori]|nr:alpha-1,2-fucosyltransferase [Helicobacter pylori]
MAFKVVQICGGLGNQMFQYAFAKSLQKHSNTPVLLDITSFDWSNRKMQLELFPIDLPYASAKEIAIAKMQHLPKLVRDALKCIGFDRVSQEIVFEYEPKLLKPSRLTYFFGYFQDPRYFDAISPFMDMTTRNKEEEAYWDMLLMQSCQHGIIANSTYSWWAAYLIENPEKIIIGPKHWLFGHENILCKEWVKIESHFEVKSKKYNA